MSWIKQGRIFAPSGQSTWAKHSALTPTPVLFGDFIRVYAGLRDEAGRSRIGFVDVATDQPSRVLRVCEDPALDIGTPGAFDDNGCILGDVVRVGDELWMYYVGFQLVEKVKFLAFTGLAVSRDGEVFSRVSAAPVLDRGDKGLFFNAIHSVRIEDGVFRAWTGTGAGWETIDGRTYPRYDVHYVESRDGLNFDPRATIPCVVSVPPEYRVGRPRVWRDGSVYRMLFTRGDVDGAYRPGYAESEDGLNWKRDDSAVDLLPSPSAGWDSKHLSYPSIIDTPAGRYAFYNGNDMGLTGFGYARWDGAGELATSKR